MLRKKACALIFEAAGNLVRFQSVLSGSCLPHMPDQTGGQAAEPFLLCVEWAAEDLPDMVHPVADGVAVDEHRIRNLPDAAVILQVVFECQDIFGIVGGIIVLKWLQVFFLRRRQIPIVSNWVSINPFRSPSVRKTSAILAAAFARR